MFKIIRLYAYIYFLIFSSFLTAEDDFSVVTEFMPPYQEIKQGNVEGAATKIVNEILSCANIKTKIQLLPWKRAYYTALHKPNTLIYSIAKTEQRKNKFIWIGTLFNTPIVLYKLKNRKDIVINNINDIKKYRLGLLRSGFITAYFINLGFKPGLNITLYNEDSSKIPMLLDSRFDLFDGNPLTMKSVISSNIKFTDAIEAVYTIKNNQKLYLAANIDSKPALINRLKICMNTIKN